MRKLLTLMAVCVVWFAIQTPAVAGTCHNCGGPGTLQIWIVSNEPQPIQLRKGVGTGGSVLYDYALERNKWQRSQGGWTRPLDIPIGLIREIGTKVGMTPCGVYENHHRMPAWVWKLVYRQGGEKKGRPACLFGTEKCRKYKLHQR